MAKQTQTQAIEQIAFACKMMAKASGDTVTAIKLGADALVTLQSYEAQQAALKELGAAYTAHQNAVRFTDAIQLQSGIRFIKSRVNKLHPDFKWAKSENPEAVAKREARAARQTGGKGVNAGVKPAEKRPTKAVVVRRSDWDSVLIQNQARVTELIESLVPVSGINQYRQALAAYNAASTAFINAVKPLIK